MTNNDPPVETEEAADPEPSPDVDPAVAALLAEVFPHLSPTVVARVLGLTIRPSTKNTEGPHQ
ncbi:hypothetical protein [Kineosporia sp. R_H_3]|uniref:hypothetical protein n=1 Tax=Kineosporia sp. R_H_3 TaxID=1961848 RepID=UPI000B4AD6DF|nr:hypothetical protein [Kineosporia sp. R_H_3]